MCRRRRAHLRLRLIAGLLGIVVCGWGAAVAQRVVLQRDNATVVLEGYAPGIVRVVLSLDAAAAQKGPGVGIVAQPAQSGWTHAASDAGDEYGSGELVVKVGAWHAPRGPLPETAKYFVGSTPGFGLEIDRADGQRVL